MPALAFFTETTLTPQSANQGYGVESADKFRVSSLFTISSNSTKAYAMVQGTILLQQQATDAGKVNLIIRPFKPKELKLPVKYIIYRGLETESFLQNNNLTDPANKVKTAGSELLAEMQVIQQDRAPGDDIPLEALFGDDLAPANDKNIDEFFFKNLAPSSQLFTIDCGIELGNFAAGEIGIEIILENPEFFVDVELAKKTKHERDVSNISDTAQKKWEKDLIRHFVDPAAFYGLHYDIKGDIEYRDGSGNKQSANTKNLVYNEILKTFKNTTRNTVYLDIRNENGYSYNYYGNYVGTGTDANKELEIGLIPTGLTKKEYYKDGWAIHLVEVITPGSNEENEFSIALRVNDNEKPLLASWNYKPEVSSGEVVSDKNVHFIDETILLASMTSSLPPFTNPITLKVPNIDGNPSKQLATLVKLDYYKQLRLNDGADAFPMENPTDYLFGPTDIDIPWDSDDRVQWISSNHQKFFDGWLNQGYFQIKHSFLIESINLGSNSIVVTNLVGVLADFSFLKIVNIPLGQTTYRIVISEINTNTNNSTLKIGGVINLSDGTIHNLSYLKNNGLVAGDNINIFNYFKATIGLKRKALLVENFNLAQYEGNTINKIKFYFKIKKNTIDYTFSSIEFNSVKNFSTIKINNSSLETRRVAFIADVGIVSENNPDSVNDDNIIFYAFPKYYYGKTGGTDTSFFNYKGGTYANGNLFDYLKEQDSGADIVRSSIEISGNTWYVLSFNSTVFVNNPNFLLLAITKNELQTLKDQTSSTASDNDIDFSAYHIKQFKLKNAGPVFVDDGGETFFQYRLVISGMDIEGNYKETPEAQGLRVFSKDGQLFSSSAYAQNVEVSGAKFMINFRRRGNYAEKGGHYGFDWMRDSYIAETDPVATRGGICIAHNTSITKQEAQDQLKQEYTPIEINGYEYYVPWLSMYENHASVVANGEQIDPTEHEVKLQLELDDLSTSNKGSVRFEAPEGIEIILKDENNNVIPQPLPASMIESKIAVIKCTQKSNLNRKIYAYDQNNHLVGALNISKNNRNFKLPKIRLIRVKFKGKVTYKIDIGFQVKFDFDFDTKKFNIESLNPMVILPDPTSGYLKINTNNWVNWIHEKDTEIKKIFRQELFEYEKFSSVYDLEIDFGDYDAANPPPNSPGINRIKNAIKNTAIPGTNLNNIEPILNIDYTGLIQGLSELYHSNQLDTDNQLPIFLLPIDTKDGNLNNIGYSLNPDNSLGIGRIVVLSILPDKKEIPYLISHEINHTLRLEHVFPDITQSDKEFMMFLTENIMDYGPPKKWVKKGSPEDNGDSNNIVIDGDPIEIKKSFWKWQWEKVQNTNPDLEI